MTKPTPDGADKAGNADTAGHARAPAKPELSAAVKQAIAQADSLPPSPIPEVGKATLAELFVALQMGWRDYRAAPQFGLFFSAVYVIVGIILVKFGAGTVAWTLTVSLGFPLVAPFAAVGLYDVSRRLEADVPLVWSEILGVVWREKDRQIPWIGAIIVIYFLFWGFLAHMLFAMVMGLSALTEITSDFGMFFTPRGMVLVAVELAVGGVFAFLLFALTLVSLPLLLEKELDFVTAMLLSLEAVRANLAVMLIWSAVVGVMIVAAMIPYFIGLLIVLPVLGHATWHIYRRLLYLPA